MRYKNPLLLTFLLLWSISLHAQEKKPIQLSDLTKIVTVADPEITPDGKQVIFVKNYLEADKDGKYDYKSQLIQMDLASVCRFPSPD